MPNGNRRYSRRPSVPLESSRIDDRPGVRISGPSLRIDAGNGRLYVSGDSMQRMSAIPGAAYNERRNAFEISLTLASLRRIRAEMRVDKHVFASWCTPGVLTWTRRAGEIENAIAALHMRIDGGWRATLPWRDRLENLPPFGHQELMATVAVSLDGTAFICGVGTGKTRAGAESIQEKVRAGEIDVAFIVCPNRVMNTWMTQIPRWTPLLRPVMLTGRSSHRIETIRRTTARGTVFILNYEMLAALMPAILEYMNRRRCGFLCDEIQKLKNPNAARTKAGLKIAAASTWRLGMTATPIVQGGHDVWSQWYIVDLGVEFGASFVQFRREMFIENEWTHEISPRSGTLTEIGLRMRKRGVRIRTEDCLDLPPQRFLDPLYVDMGQEQAIAYESMKAMLVAELSSGENATAANQLSVMLRLSQITSGFVMSESGALHRFDPNPKLVALDELVRENINNEQIIVWAYYKPDLDLLTHHFREFRPAVVRGGMSLDATALAERRFQDGTTRLFIGQQSAGGVGLNLQAGSLNWYFSQMYSLEDRIQSEGRSWRSGSEIHSRVGYQDIRCRGTSDDIVGAALRSKDTVAKVVIDLRQHIGL